MTPGVTDGPQTLVGAVRRRTAEIVGALDGLDEIDTPSALPDWSRLTIACHLRYGAEALLRMTVASLDGRTEAYYPSGREVQRSATLRPQPGEQPVEVVASLAAAGHTLDERWSGLNAADWERVGGAGDLGPLPLAALVVLRLTEVEVHGGDLDLGLSDWSDVFVQAALPFRLEWLNVRRSNHRAVDGSIQGSWLLVPSDGPTYLVTVEAHTVTSRPAPAHTPATAVIEGSSRDLLALLLGRPARRPLRYGGDADVAASFGAAFPGP